MLLGFFAFGFIGIFFLEYFNREKNDSSPASKAVSHHSDRAIKSFLMPEKADGKEMFTNISQFFDVVLPVEFRQRPWYSKFWIRTLERHPYIAFLAPAEGRANYTAKKWMCMAFELLNIIFIDSIFAPIAAPDSEVCGKFTTASACAKPSSIDLIDSLCEWDDGSNLCAFREIDQNMGVIIIAVLIIKLVEFPLMTLCEYLVDQVGNSNVLNSQVENEPQRHKKPSISDGSRDFVPILVESGKVHDSENSKIRPFAKVVPFALEERLESDQKDRQVLYRLAARLRYMQRKIDESTVEEELDYLMTHADLHVKSDVIEELLSALRAKFSLTDAQNRDKLGLKVHRARNMRVTVLQELEEMSGRDEQEIYLVKRFIVELLSGVHRWVAERFFFDEVESEITVWYRAFCIMLLILIICGELTFVFLTGVGMGANATRVWFICLAVVVMQGKEMRFAAIALTNQTNPQTYSC